MVEAENVLKADYTINDEPLDTSRVEGLDEVINRISEAEEGEEFLHCEDEIADYKVYWNSKTDTVRVGAVYLLASYEVSQDD